MANKVSTSSNLPNPHSFQKVQDATSYIQQLVNSLSGYLYSMSLRLNLAMVADGSEVPTAPVMHNTYAKAALPSASTFKSGIIMVSDDVGGFTPAFSDGTNWRRTADRNVIS